MVDIPAPTLSFPDISHSRGSRRDRFGWETEGITAQLTPNRREKFILFTDQLNLAVLGFGMWCRAHPVHPGSSWVWECECHIQQNKWNDGITKIGEKASRTEVQTLLQSGGD